MITSNTTTVTVVCLRCEAAPMLRSAAYIATWSDRDTLADDAGGWALTLVDYVDTVIVLMNCLLRTVGTEMAFRVSSGVMLDRVLCQVA